MQIRLGSFWSRLAVERTKPGPGCSAARNCANDRGSSSSLSDFWPWAEQFNNSLARLRTIILTT